MAPLAKVLIIVENLPVPNDRRVWLEATALHEAGYHVSVISIKGVNAEKSHEILEGINIYRYPAPPQTKGVFSYLWEFTYCWVMTFLLSFKVLLREGIDIIHACNPPETFWFIGLFYKLFGKGFLFDHHDPSPEMYQARFKEKGFAFRLLLLLERLTFKTADVVVTTNETLRRIAIERGKFPSNRIFVVRSGPDHRALCPCSANVALKRGHQYMVTYLGMLNPQDGVDLFIQLAAYFHNRLHRRDILFAIMGTGDAEQELRKLALDFGVADHVHFTGWVERNTIQEYLAASDVCVDTMPKTSYGDAILPNKILEYMSMARPIVMFDLAETHTSIQDSALYARPNDIYDLADKIISLLTDTDQRIRIGTAGRKRIETTLAWEHQKASLLAAYKFVRNSKI